MGWAGGSELMDKVIEAQMKACKSLYLRQRFYMRVIPAFQDQDWDVEEECIGKDSAFDAALKLIWKKQGVDWPGEEDT